MVPITWPAAAPAVQAWQIRTQRGPALRCNALVPTGLACTQRTLNFAHQRHLARGPSAAVELAFEPNWQMATSCACNESLSIAQPGVALQQRGLCTLTAGYASSTPCEVGRQLHACVHSKVQRGMVHGCRLRLLREAAGIPLKAQTCSAA